MAIFRLIDSARYIPIMSIQSLCPVSINSRRTRRSIALDLSREAALLFTKRRRASRVKSAPLTQERFKASRPLQQTPPRSLIGDRGGSVFQGGAEHTDDRWWHTFQTELMSPCTSVLRHFSCKLALRCKLVLRTIHIPAVGRVEMRCHRLSITAPALGY
jgi:hypothetical protein